MTASRKPAGKKSADRASLDAGLSIPPPPAPGGKASAKGSAAAEALKRLSSMTPEEQAAALFESMRVSNSRKDP